jgi:hypothetical protein
MSLPATPKVVIRFGTGAGFGNVLILGDANEGILGTNVLGTSAAIPVDITDNVMSINTRRGRDRVFDQYNNGSATVTFIDKTGDFDPSNSSGPYFGEILPMRQLRISADYSSNTYYLFSGYIVSWDFEYVPAWEGTLVTVTAEDGFRLLNLAEIETVSGSAPQDLPGTRINQILDAAGWPNGLRSISAGAVELLDDPWTARPALQAAQTIELTEEGALFCDKTGILVFKSRQDIIDQAGGTPTIFDDDGTDIAYQGIDLALDDSELANDVTVQAEGGAEQQASDSTSIEQYFKRSLSRTGLMFYDDADALSQAQRLLAYRKDVQLRIESIELDCSTSSNRVLAALSLNLNDPIQVNKTNVGGVDLSVDLLIQGIDHDIQPDRWRTTFSTALPPSE